MDPFEDLLIVSTFYRKRESLDNNFGTKYSWFKMTEPLTDSCQSIE